MVSPSGRRPSARRRRLPAQPGVAVDHVRDLVREQTVAVALTRAESYVALPAERPRAQAGGRRHGSGVGVQADSGQVGAKSRLKEGPRGGRKWPADPQARQRGRGNRAAGRRPGRVGHGRRQRGARPGVRGTLQPVICGSDGRTGADHPGEGHAQRRGRSRPHARSAPGGDVGRCPLLGGARRLRPHSLGNALSTARFSRISRISRISAKSIHRSAFTTAVADEHGHPSRGRNAVRWRKLPAQPKQRGQPANWAAAYA
jgi:hypothetical protein